MRPVGLSAGGVQHYGRRTVAVHGDQFVVSSTLACFVYSMETHAMERILALHNHGITSVDWSSAKPHPILTACTDNTIRIWDSITCQQDDLVSTTTTPRDASFSPHGDEVLFTCHNGTAGIWTLTGPNRGVAQLSGTPSGPCTVGKWDPGRVDKPRFVIGGRSHIAVYERHRGEYRRVANMNVNSPVSSFTWDPNSPDYLLVATKDALQLLDVSKESIIQVFEPIGEIAAVDFIPGIPGGFVSLDRSSGSIRVWNVSQKKPKRGMRISDAIGHSLHMISKEYGCFVTFMDGSLIQFDPLNNRTLFSKPAAHTETVFDAVFHPLDPDRFFTGSYDTSIRSWRIEDHKQLSHCDSISTERLQRAQLELNASQKCPPQRIAPDGVLCGHTAVVYSVDISADGQYLVSGAANGQVFLWDLESGALLMDMSPHSDAVFRVVFCKEHPDLFASASRDGKVIIYRVGQPEPYHEVNVNRPCYSVSFMAGSKMFVVGTGAAREGPGGVFVYDTSSTQPLRVLRGHTQRVFRALAHPSLPNFIASASNDNTIRIWDIGRTRGAECLNTLTGHTANVRALRWHPLIPFVLVSGSWDCTIRVWDVRNKSIPLLRTVTDHASDVYSVDLHPMRPMTVLSVSRDTTMRLWSMLEDTIHQIDKLALPLFLNPTDACVGETFKSDARALFSTSSRWAFAGPVAIALRDKLLEVPESNVFGRRALIAEALMPPVGIRNLFAVLSMVYHVESPVSFQGHVLVRPPPLQQDHYAAEVSSLFAKYKGNKYTGIGDARVEDILTYASSLALRAGILKEYCDIQVYLQNWTRALVLAPSISLEYWRELMKQYLETISGDESVSEDTILATMIAAGCSSQAATRLMNCGNFDTAALIALMPTNLQCSSTEVIPDDGDSNMVFQAAIARAETLVEVGEPVLAACLYLSIEEPIDAMRVLLDANQIVLAQLIFDTLSQQSTAQLYALKNTLDRKMVYRYERVGLYDLALSLARRLPEDSNWIFAEVLARSAQADSINGPALYDRMGMESISYYAEAAQRRMDSGDDEAALSYAVMGHQADLAVGIAVALLDRYINHIETFDLEKAASVITLITAVPLSEVSPQMAAQVSAYACYVGYFKLSQVCGQASAIETQLPHFAPRNSLHAARLVAANMLAAIQNLRAKFGLVHPPVPAPPRSITLPEAKHFAFNVQGGGYPSPPPGTGAVFSRSRRPMTLRELALWASVNPISWASIIMPHTSYTVMARGVRKSGYMILDRVFPL